MPIYDYRCEQCGEFSVLRKMSESSLPAMCDQCGEPAPRIISAPRLALMDSGRRIAFERNEKSAHDRRDVQAVVVQAHTPVLQAITAPLLPVQSNKVLA